MLPCPAAIVAVADILRAGLIRLHGGIPCGIDSHNHLFRAGLETCGVLVVYHRGPRPDPTNIIRLYRVVYLLPVDKIGAYGMPPPTRSPIQSQFDAEKRGDTRRPSRLNRWDR